jgi:hypothetical protein
LRKTKTMISTLSLNDDSLNSSSALWKHIGDELNKLVDGITDVKSGLKEAYSLNKEKELEQDLIVDMFTDPSFQIKMFSLFLEEINSKKSEIINALDQDSAIEFCLDLKIFPLLQDKIKDIDHSMEVQSVQHLSVLTKALEIVDTFCELYYQAEEIADKESNEMLEYIDSEISLLINSDRKRSVVSSAEDLFDIL